MTDETVLEVFRAAWRGLGVRFAGDPEKLSRVRERYLYDLRTARTPDRGRGLLAELLAEGLTAAGGSDHFRGEEPCLDLWRRLESDWQAVRDLALVAAASSPGAAEGGAP